MKKKRGHEVIEVDIEYRSAPEGGSRHPLYNEMSRKKVRSQDGLIDIANQATYWDKGLPVIYYLNTYGPDGLVERKPIKFDNMLNKGAIDSSLAFMTGRQKLWENLAKTANIVKPMPWVLIGLIIMALVLGGSFGASLYNPLNHTEPISNAPTRTLVWNVTNTFTFTSQSQPTSVSTVTITTTQSASSTQLTTITIPTTSTTTSSSLTTSSITTSSTVINSTTSSTVTNSTTSTTP